MKKLGRKTVATFLTTICVFSSTISAFTISAEDFELSLYKEGIRHDDVKIIQQALKKDGVFNNDYVTTYYGPITEQAVKNFQRKHGLVADGIVGKSTIGKMETLGLFTYGNLSLSLYKKGMNHNDIKILQQALKADGVYINDCFTTYFGPVTEQAVKDFQRKYGLAVDGIAGKSTIAKLKSLGLVTCNTNIATSRGSSNRKHGEYLDWWKDVRKIMERNKTVLTIQDVKTGLRFKVKVTAGTNHADVEALTVNDTNVMKKIWGGFSWARRPVLVFLNGRTIAASMSNMPHAGVESKPAGKYVSNRSCGYGYGYNYDFVKGNGMAGHVDLHFRNSRRHMDNKQDPRHQECVKIAAGLK